MTEMEIQVSLKDSDIIPLHHEKLRLQKEVDHLTSHTAWLEQELITKQKEYQHLRQESYDHTIQLQLQYDQTSNELIAVDTKFKMQQKLEYQLQQQIQQMTSDNIQLKLQLQQLEQTSQQEIQQQQLLIAKQKEHMDKWQTRYDDVVRENETLQRTAQEAMTASQSEIQTIQEQMEAKYVTIIQEQAMSYETKLKELQHQYELDEERHDTTPVMRITDGTSTTPTTVRRGDVEGDDNEMSDGGPIMNMTDLYSKWEECKTALRREVQTRKQWQYQFQRVQQEILQKAPEMIRQRQEYEMAIAQLQDYQTRLSSVLQDRDAAIVEKREMLQDLQRSEQQLLHQKEQTQELAKQVQALLVSRSGHANDDINDIPTSVVEMQHQNQRLLMEHRRLMEQVEELQHQLQNDTSKVTLETTRKEIDVLHQQQKEQEVLIEKIVQQRDLYRALLCKHDSAILTNNTNVEEVSALKMVQQQSERMKQYEKENLELHTTIKQLQSELDRTLRDKEHNDEKIKRYDSVQTEMTSKMNEIQNELLQSKGMIARTEADAKYHIDKCTRLNESLTRAQQEIQQIHQTKSELQKLNLELQAMVSSSNNEQSQTMGEKRTLEGKVRLLEAQLLTSNNELNRLLGDNEQLRHEISNQGTMIESIRRIETSLSVKSEQEVQGLQKEIETLTQKLGTTEKQYATQMEHATARIADLESTIQDYQKKSHEAIQAKSELLEAKTELQSLKTSYEKLEKQLQLAKRKLGDSVDVEDIETKLQLQIDALEMELSNTKSELVAAQERAENYQTMAKTNEIELIDIRSTTDTYKLETEKEIKELKELLATSQKENVSRQEIIRDLTNDLAGQRGEREKVVQELQGQIATLQSTIQSNEQDVIAAKAMASALQQDIATLRAECTSAQNNYERELTQHAQARTSLRLSYETVEEATRARSVAEERAKAMQTELDQCQQNWDQEKAAMQQVCKLLEQSVQEARDQNKVLHSQLETLNSLIEKNQSARISAVVTEGTESGEAAATADMETQQLLSELREVVRFMRSENELLQMQLDTAKRTTDREKAALVVARRSLEEARTELQHYVAKEKESEDSKMESNTAATTRQNEEQLVLLRDSNNLLRTEVEQLKSNLKSTHEELVTFRKAAQPIEAIQREMDMKVTALTAEKSSLERELESWKGRMTSLVSNFNQIDPEEHRLLQKKLEEMKQASESHNAWKKTTEEENSRIRTIAQNLNKQRKEFLQKIESQKNEIEQLSNEKLVLSASSGVGSKAQKELDEMKQRISKMENDAKSAKTELDGANSRNDRLRDKLREFQNMIRDLRSKEKSLSEQLKEIQDSASAHAPSETVDVGAGQPRPADTTPPAPTETVEDTPVSEPIAAHENTEASQESSTISIPTPPPFKFGPSKSTAASLRPNAVPFVPPTSATTLISKPPPIEVPSEKGATSKRSIDSISKPTAEVENVPEIVKDVKQDAVSSESKGKQDAVSSESKELAFKEKLLERKRQLAEALKEKALKRKQKEAEQEQAKVDTKEEKHVEKKARTEDNPPLSLDSPSLKGTDTELNTQVVPEGTSNSVEAAVDTATTDAQAKSSGENIGVQVETAVVADEADATQESVQAEAIVVDDDNNNNGQPEMEAEVVDVVVENDDGNGAMDDENLPETDEIIEVDIETDDVAEGMDESASTKMMDTTSPLPFASPFGLSSSTATTFGGSSSVPMFGQSSSMMSSPFGSNPLDATAGSSNSGTMLFGAFGSSAGGGGSSSSSSSNPTATATTFGSINNNTTSVTALSSSSSIPFGSAAFLDIKPPSNQFTPETMPKFTFGNSGSNITLPTPTMPTNPSGTMSGMSSNSGGGGGGGGGGASMMMMMMSQQPFGAFPSGTFGSVGGGGGGSHTTTTNTFGSFSSTMGGGFGSTTSTMPLFGTSSSIAMPIVTTTNTHPGSDHMDQMDDDENIHHPNDEGAMDAQEEEEEVE